MCVYAVSLEAWIKLLHLSVPILMRLPYLWIGWFVLVSVYIAHPALETTRCLYCTASKRFVT